MSVPWVSIVTITKGDPSGLSRTLASTADFRAQGAQHIVVDGGGSWTPALETEVVAKPTVLERGPHGISDAFNFGLEHAQSEWVWFLNGGDQRAPSLDTGFLQTFLRSTRADMVIGGLIYEGEVKTRPHPAPRFRWPPIPCWIPHPATLVRRRLFDRFGRFDTHYSIAMDYDWWLRVTTQDVEVDVVSVPFSVFAPGGVSQDVAPGGRLEQERDRTVLSNGLVVARDWLGAGVRLANVAGVASVRALRKRVAR